ncbi:hypothetical protein GIB67_041992, partial [Kingdonia uniflora]
MNNLLAKDARDAELQGVITEVPEIIMRCISRDEVALAIAKKVIYSDEDRKFNKDITIEAATEFSIFLLQTLVAQEPGISVSELHNLVDALV